MRKVELSWRKVAVCGVVTIAVVVVRIGSEPIGVTLAQIYSPGAGVSAVPVGAESSPASTWDVYEGNRWRVLAGGLSLGPASELPPDGSMATDIRVNEPGPLWVEYTLPAVRDLTAVDSLTFWARTSTSRIGDFVYLVDSGGNRAWYKFSLVGERGWQQFSYWLKSPWGRDANFRFDSVAKVRFAQSLMASGDVIAIGTPRFEWGVMSHCESSAGWYVDIGSAGSSISVSTEAVGGKFSFLAALVTNSWGQADVAMSKATTGGGVGPLRKEDPVLLLEGPVVRDRPLPAFLRRIRSVSAMDVR
jgi:hypothetical protein